MKRAQPYKQLSLFDKHFLKVDSREVHIIVLDIPTNKGFILFRKELLVAAFMAADIKENNKARRILGLNV